MGENTRTCCCECDHSEAALLARIGELAAEYRGKEGSLIQVLHMAQGIYGYLPIEVQRVIADTLDIPLAEVAGVVTFYSFFSTQPRGRHTIRVCLGTACYVRGGKKIVERIKELLDVEIGETTKDRLFTLRWPMHRRLRPGSGHVHRRPGLQTGEPRQTGTDSETLL